MLLLLLLLLLLFFTLHLLCKNRTEEDEILTKLLLLHHMNNSMYIMYIYKYMIRILLITFHSTRETSSYIISRSSVRDKKRTIFTQRRKYKKGRESQLKECDMCVYIRQKSHNSQLCVYAYISSYIGIYADTN